MMDDTGTETKFLLTTNFLTLTRIVLGIPFLGEKLTGKTAVSPPLWRCVRILDALGSPAALLAILQESDAHLISKNKVEHLASSHKLDVFTSR